MQTSEILKDLRISAGYTQKDLSHLLGIGQSTIVGYEKGEREATARILALYADFFNCSVDYLLGRADDLGTIAISPSPALELTTEEKELVDTFRRLPPNLQGIAIQTLHSFAGDQERKDQSDTLPRRA